ncbi:hypothetical protein FZC78_19210 [Rossellomorea vietnamensis]|uniref:Rho termination factor N-terminal domain-containing protein n=1 Tax=Rossellomorea vietnamensis TaxID=218284 RepID=A0A5D4NKJ6_9BACI|nr:hypothetical protein [Rossellomorea vietnamensis]TYS14284.1 hypothetical protein FZC78_19210 [Rossellomorea vietnamensis]
MNVETRKTAQGTEYWDSKEKRVRFVPAGKEPDFEVAENPKSMVKEEKQDTETDIDLDKMDADQLLAFAEQNDIEVPGNMKKAETIRNHIEESLTAAEE